jgi:hypothetical protein
VGVDGDPPVEPLGGVEVAVRVRQVGQPFDRGPVSRRARERPCVERGRGAPFASSTLDVAELGPAECLLLGDRPGGDSRARNPELARRRLRAAQSLEPKRRLEVPGHRPRLETGERIGRALVAAGRERRIEQDRPGARGYRRVRHRNLRFGEGLREVVPGEEHGGQPGPRRRRIRVPRDQVPGQVLGPRHVRDVRRQLEALHVTAREVRHQQRVAGILSQPPFEELDGTGRRRDVGRGPGLRGYRDGAPRAQVRGRERGQREDPDPDRSRPASPRGHG